MYVEPGTRLERGFGRPQASASASASLPVHQGHGRTWSGMTVTRTGFQASTDLDTDSRPRPGATPRGTPSAPSLDLHVAFLVGPASPAPVHTATPPVRRPRVRRQAAFILCWNGGSSPELPALLRNSSFRGWCGGPVGLQGFSSDTRR